MTKYEIVFFLSFYIVCSFKAHKRCVDEAALEASMVYRKPYDFGPELLITSAVVRVSRESGTVQAVENITSLPSTSAAVMKNVTGLTSTSTVVPVKDTTVSLPGTDETVTNDIHRSSGAEAEMKPTSASRPDVVNSTSQPDSNVGAEEINRLGSMNKWFKIWSRRFIFCLLIFMC